MAVFNNFHNEQILKLDVKQQQPNKIPRFVQYDSALLKIELYDNGKLYDVSRADEFVVSAKRPDGSKVSGLAEYDGEFITYKLSKQDLELLGETDARLQVYEGRNRLSSLSFRYDVYEDFEAVGNPDDVTLLSALLQQVRDALADAQRQGGYAENRGDFANAAGDFANSAGDSQKMRWLKWVKTVEERNSTYRNPRNGDTVYVVNVADKNGGAVYRYNAIERPHKWEEISGWDTSIIQDIYNLIDTKEDKTKVLELVTKLEKDLEDLEIGGRNLIADSHFYGGVVNGWSETYGTQTVIDDVLTKTFTETNASSRIERSFTGLSAGRYTLSLYANIPHELKWRGFVNASFISDKILGSTDGFARYSVTFEVHENQTTTTIRGYLENIPNGTDVEIDWFQLERGDKATDWKPAYEDIVSHYQKLIEELRVETEEKFTKHNARLEVLEDKIQMTVKEETYDAEMDIITKWQSDYEQTARDITTTVSKKVGNDEIISKINQSAEEISIDANKVNLNGYVTISNLETGKAKVHPDNLHDWGMTTVDGGTLTIDKLNIRRPNGEYQMLQGRVVAEYSAQRYEPDFSSAQPNHDNGRVWNPNGTFYEAPLAAIYGQKGHSSWPEHPEFEGYIDARGEDGYTNVQAYRVIQTARYLVVRYGVKTDSTGIMVRLSESAAAGTGLMVSRSHSYLEEGSGYGQGGEFNHVIDLESIGSKFGKGRLFYVKATAPNTDRVLGNAAKRTPKIRLLGVYLTDNPPTGHENIV